MGNATLDENCTNPEVLYESIVAKLEDVFYYIRYVYFDGTTMYEYAKLLGCRRWAIAELCDHPQSLMDITYFCKL